MSKVVISPVKRFPGTVTLPSFLTFPQAIAWEKAGKLNDTMYDTEEGAPDAEGNPTYTRTRKAEYTGAEAAQSLIPGILACVEAWNIDWRLENVPATPTLETFPTTPRLSALNLVYWLASEINALYKEEDEIPND